MIELFNGDCLEIMPSLSQVDVVIADPPYGVTNNKWDTVIDIDKMWAALTSINPKVIILTSQNPFASQLITSNKRHFRYEIIWEKSKASGFLNAKKQPLRAHENILIFSEKAPPYYPVMSGGEPYNKGVRKQQSSDDSYGKYNQTEVKSSGKRYPRSVVRFKTAEREGGYHKTQKPVALMEYLISTYSQMGDTVLDFCMGSGTTGVACKKIGRRFIGIEIDKSCFDIARERIELT